MSAVIETFLQCDSCYENYGVDNRGYTAKQHRWHAKKDGWVYSNGKDYCPNCRANTSSLTAKPKDNE